MCILCLLHIGGKHTVIILLSEPLIIEHVVNMATTSKAIIKHKLPSVQEKLDTTRIYIKFSSQKKKNLLRTLHFLVSLTPCRRVTQKCVITVPCVVDGSRISAFFYATSCTCVSHLVWLTYRFKVIASLMQDAWVSSYKQTDWS